MMTVASITSERATASACAVTVSPAESMPLTALQQAMVAGELSPEKWQRDVVQIRCDLSESVNVDVLGQALAQLAARHESLRATLNWNESGSQQDVVDHVEIPLHLLDVQDKATQECQAQIDHHLHDIWAKPFTVTQPPRLSASLVRHADEQFQFILTYQETELDEHSGKLLMQDVLELYDRMMGHSDKQMRPAISFREYLTWLTSHRDTEACHYWGNLLNEAPAPTAPPLLGIGHVDQDLSHCLGNMIGQLSQEATDRLKAWANKHHATMNTVLLAAWSRVLAEHAAQDDVRFSAVFSLRDPSYEHAQTAVAMCFSVLPFIVKNVRNISADELLIMVRDHEAASRKHSMFLDGSTATRRQLGHPSSQSLIFFDECDVDDFIHRKHPEWRQRKFTLFGRNPYAIAMRGFGGDQLRIQVWYNPGSYDRRAAGCLLNQLLRVLELLPLRHNLPVSTSDFVTTEHMALLRQWERGPDVPYRTSLLHDFIHEHAERTPDVTAIISNDGDMNFRQLDLQSNRIANLLLHHEIQPGGTVAICMKRTPGMIASMVGALKAGDAYVPIEPAWPSERIAGLFRQLGTRSVITDGAHIDRVQAALRGSHSVTTVIQWDAERPDAWDHNTAWYGSRDIALSPATSVNSAKTPDDPAYVIFTSGSTGQPKGVKVSHRAVCNLIDWARGHFNFDGCDRALWVTSSGFDLSVFDIFGILACGGAIRIAGEEDLASPGKLLDILTKEPVTFWDSAPQALDRVMKWVEHNPLPADADVSQLCLIFLSGDWIPLHLPDAVRRIFPNAKVISLGGATEATVWSNVYEIDQIGPNWRSIPYGRPIQNARYYVLNEHRKRCGVGVTGELYIAGDVLADGYAADPKQTSERFVPDINTESHPGSRMYRTGDLARWWPDGMMEILGRMDQQVKVRGYRIELGEIEQALRSCPDVQEAIVIARRQEHGENQLIGYVVGRSATAIKYDSLQNHLRRTLPDYMIPTVFVILDVLPMTANGKLDRRALERMQTCCQPLRQREYVPASTPREQALASIFTRVLRIERVGAHDNFIELGGDSLSALDVIFTAEQMDIHLTMNQLRQWDVKTLAGRHCQANAGTKASCAVTNIPLIPNQRWLLERSFGRPASYGFMAWIKAHSPLNCDTLTQAWRHVLNHHEALRTRFTHDGDLRQHIAPAENRVHVEQIDLRHMDLIAIDQQLEQIALRVSRQCELFNSLLPSLTLVTARDDQSLVFIHIPHMIIDDYSARIVVDDLSTAYVSLADRREVILPPATTSISQWAEIVEQAIESAQLREEFERFRALPWDDAGELPRNGKSDDNTYAHAQDVCLAVSHDDTQNLLDFARRNRVSLESLLIASLGHALGPWVNKRNLPIDITGSGRESLCDDAPLHRSVGYFSTIHPVMIRCDGAEPDAETIRHMDKMLKQAPGRGVWYGLMRYGSTSPAMRDALMSLPQAQIKFNYHGLQPLCADSSLFKQAHIPLPRAMLPADKRRYLLNLEIYVRDGRLTTTWKYASRIHHRSTIAELASRYVDSICNYKCKESITVARAVFNQSPVADVMEG